MTKQIVCVIVLPEEMIDESFELCGLPDYTQMFIYSPEDKRLLFSGDTTHDRPFEYLDGLIQGIKMVPVRTEVEWCVYPLKDYKRATDAEIVSALNDPIAPNRNLSKLSLGK